MRQRRGRRVQGARPGAEGEYPVRSGGQQHHAGSGGPQNSGPPVPLGRRGRGEPQTQRLHQAAHVPDLNAHAGPQGRHRGRALRELPGAVHLADFPARVPRKRVCVRDINFQ